jgi:hypothetical protein
MPDFTRRNWYPDPLTATLIARLPPDQPDCCDHGKKSNVKHLLWREMIGALRSSGLRKGDEPESLSEFLADLRIASQVKMPSLLAAYAAHGIRSQGLPAKTLRRIYTVRAAEPVPIVGESRPQPEDERVLDSWDECPREVEPGLEKALLTGDN